MIKARSRVNFFLGKKLNSNRVLTHIEDDEGKKIVDPMKMN